MEKSRTRKTSASSPCSAISKEGRGAIDTPIYDYGMIDDDFMLAPVTANWLLAADGRTVAAKFLSTQNATGRATGRRAGANLVWVVERTAAFAADPKAANLVGLKEGRMTGQWRDSEEGLGRGRYAYDVNAVFVPAALDAIDRLLKSGFARYLSDGCPASHVAAGEHSTRRVVTQGATDVRRDLASETGTGSDRRLCHRGRRGCKRRRLPRWTVACASNR